MSSFDEFLTDTQVSGNAEAIPCALGVRVRLARNINGFPFPGWAKGDRRREVSKKILSATECVSGLRDAYHFDLAELSELRKKFLIECRYISPDLGGDGCGVIIARSRDIAIMINEEDHIRAQIFSGGDNLGEAWAKARALDKEFSANLDFAFSEKYGFLTACPTNAGTGMRVSVMLHLPGFVMEGQIEKMLRALNAVGLTARGCFGEGSDAKGCIFQISNDHTLGISESETLALMRRWVAEIIQQEMCTRRRIFSRERALIADRIARAYGALRFAVSLSADESTELLSLLRLACDTGYFSEGTREKLDDLLVETGQAHIGCRSSFRGILCDESRENLLRGTLFRETLSSIHPPIFPDYLK